MRAFFGIPLDDGLRSGVGKVQEDLRAAGADVSWVRPESLHLTVKFLGNVPDNTRFVLPPLRPFVLELADIGEFDGRVVWAGCQRDIDALRKLVGILESEAARFGIPKERRPFEPHVTIGRIRSRKNLEALRDRMNKWGGHVFGRWPVRRVVFFRSETSPSGSVYKVVADYPCVEP